MNQNLTIRFWGDLTAPQQTLGLLNDVVMAIKFARKDLALVKEILIRKSGIYFLMTEMIFCPNTTEIYIGESENILERIKQHIIPEENWWSYCIAIIDRNGDLNKGDVEYLESALIKRALDMRFKLKNKKSPNIIGTQILERFLAGIEYHLYVLNGPCFINPTGGMGVSDQDNSEQSKTFDETHEKQSEDVLSVVTGLEIFTKDIRKRLQNVNITNIDELITLTYHEFSAIPGIGGRTAEYVKKELERNGLKFCEEQIPIVPVVAPIHQYFELNRVQQEAVSTWLTETTEDRICVRMIFHEVLCFPKNKRSRRVSNEISMLIREHERWMQHPGKSGKMRFSKYGVQVGFIRKSQ